MSDEKCRSLWLPFLETQGWMETQKKPLTRWRCRYLSHVPKQPLTLGLSTPVT